MSIARPRMSAVTSLREDIAKIWRVPAPQNTMAFCEMHRPFKGGSVNVALRIKELDPSAKIAVLVAANSGRPGGSIGHTRKTSSGYEPYIVREQLHPHGSQEEDIMASWMHGEAAHQRKDLGLVANGIFKNTIGRAWGMTYPDRVNGTGMFHTLQGVDYRTATPDQYYDAWHVSGCHLAKKVRSDRFDTSTRVEADLIFVAGPQADGSHHKPSGPEYAGDFSGTQYRTANENAAADYDYFIECVKKALEALFATALMMGDDTIVLCHLSGDLYAGRWKASAFARAPYKDFEDAVNDVLLNRKYADSGIEYGRFFKHVVFAPYASP